MSDTLIDIIHNILKYNGENILIAVDKDEMIWFSALNVAKILEYNRPNDAILRLNKIYKTELKNLKQYFKKLPPNSQPHAIFINEFGLYDLILSSRKPIAKKFREWVITEVLPSIREFGYYHVNDESQKKYDELNEKFRRSKRTIKILKQNQKKKNLPKGGVIYVLRPIDQVNKKFIRVGRSTKLDKRIAVYNSSVPDNMELLFTLQVDDPVAVEYCIKGLMHKYIYRANKEYYECSLSLMVKAIQGCDKLVHGNFFCTKCSTEHESLEHFVEHVGDAMNTLYLDLNLDQTGGDDEIIEYEHLFEHPIDEFHDELSQYCNLLLTPSNQNGTTTYKCKVEDAYTMLKNTTSDILQLFFITLNMNDLDLDDDIIIELVDKTSKTNKQIGGSAKQTFGTSELDKIMSNGYQNIFKSLK